MLLLLLLLELDDEEDDDDDDEELEFGFVNNANCSSPIPTILSIFNEVKLVKAAMEVIALDPERRKMEGEMGLGYGR